MNPAARRTFGKARLDLHTIGQKLFHLRGGGTDQTLALVVFDQINIERVKTSRRFVGGLIAEFGKASLRQGEFLCLDRQIARIHNFGFNGQTLEIAAPASLFHHQPDVNFVSRPVNTALGKNECVETFRRDVLRPFNLEARKIQDAVFTREGHERNVVAVARDKRHG